MAQQSGTIILAVVAAVAVVVVLAILVIRRARAAPTDPATRTGSETPPNGPDAGSARGVARVRPMPVNPPVAAVDPFRGVTPVLHNRARNGAVSDGLGP
jgi:hypothetical protein